jgi:hypothetical protein
MSTRKVPAAVARISPVGGLKLEKCPVSRHFFSGSDGTRTRDLRRDRPAL